MKTLYIYINIKKKKRNLGSDGLKVQQHFHEKKIKNKSYIKKKFIPFCEIQYIVLGFYVFQMYKILS